MPLLVDRIREAAVNAGPTPGNPWIHQVQDEMERLGQWSGKDYEGPIPVTGESPLTVLPTVEEDRTDELDEIEELTDAGDEWDAQAVPVDTGDGGNADAADGVTGEGLRWTAQGWVDRDGKPVVW